MSKDYKGMAARMKKYEATNRNYLIPNMNTIIRLDGKAFHTYTKQFKRPFDQDLIDLMDQTAIYLCSKIQGAKFAFVQSDEISIALTDYDSYETGLWYEGNVQKMVSVSASMAAAKFNHLRVIQLMKGAKFKAQTYNAGLHASEPSFDEASQIDTDVSTMQLAEFDSRVFQLPNRAELLNAFLWRQQDATRNSISSVAQSLYSDKELYKKNTDQMQEMIFQKGINWNDYDPKLKRGRFIQKVLYINDVKHDHLMSSIKEDPEFNLNSKVRTKWESTECPIFSQDPKFIYDKLPTQF